MTTRPHAPPAGGIALWRDLPRAAWPVIFGYWARTAALAWLAIAVGRIVDGHGRAWWLVALGGLAVAAATLWFAEIRTARIHADEESRLRGGALRGWWAVPSPGDDRSGGVVALLTDSAVKAANYRAEFLGPTIAAISAPLLVVAVVAWGLDAWLGLVLGVLVLAVPAVTVGFGSLVRSSAGRYRRVGATVAGRFLEVLRALGLLRLLGATQRGRGILEEGADTVATTMFAMLRKDQLMIIVNDLLFSAGLVSLMLAWIWRDYSAGTLSAGEVVAGILLAVQLYEPIDSLGRTFYVGRGGRPPLERLRQVAARGRRDIPRAVPAEPARVELRDVTIRRGEHRVVAGLNLTVAAGATLGVVGPTGAGKTSLALAIQGLIGIEGALLIDGSPATPGDLAATVTTVPQRPHVFAGTVADNLRLGAAEATDEQLRDALERVRLLDELPGGLGTPLGEAGHGLSGGQIRRLALARALLTRPRVLILDELTADLDHRNCALLGEAVAALRPRTTVIQIAHRLATVHDADQVLVLDGEPRVARVAELLAEGGYFARASQLERR